MHFVQQQAIREDLCAVSSILYHLLFIFSSRSEGENENMSRETLSILPILDSYYFICKDIVLILVLTEYLFLLKNGKERVVQKFYKNRKIMYKDYNSL